MTTIAPVKQRDGKWRADDTMDDVPLCTIEFHNDLALLADEHKRALVLALIQRYCQADIP